MKAVVASGQNQFGVEEIELLPPAANEVCTTIPKDGGTLQFL